MGRVGNKNFLARIAAGFLKRSDHQDSGELAVSSCSRLQGDSIHAGDLGQRAFQRIDNFEAALGQGLRLVRMRPRQPLGTCDEFVHTGVVLHGARTQRIQA